MQLKAGTPSWIETNTMIYPRSWYIQRGREDSEWYGPPYRNPYPVGDARHVLYAIGWDAAVEEKQLYQKIVIDDSAIPPYIDECEVHEGIASDTERNSSPVHPRSS